jgi:hypothetical protein
MTKQNNNFIHPIELGLFRSHRSHYNRCSDNDNDDEQQQGATIPKVVVVISHAVKRISQKLKIIRSFLSSLRFSSIFHNKKGRCLSILAAAIIAAGTFPSRVTAEPSINRNNPMTSLTKIVATMDSEINKSMAKNKFLQYDSKAPNNYFEDGRVDGLFDTVLPATGVTNAVLEKIDSKSIEREPETTIDGFSSALPIAEDVGQILNKQSEDDLLILNDKMIKTGIKNIAVLGTGTAALLLLTRKGATSLNSEDDNSDERADDIVKAYDKIIPATSEPTTVDPVAESPADETVRLPLLDPKYVDARKQPKPPSEKAILAARYAAIPTVEERAYQILVDLGMVEVGQ